VRLRRRLNTVLLQWFLLFVILAGTVWVVFVPGLRQERVDDRLLLARTIAQSLDVTISQSIQGLGRLATDLPLALPEAAAGLRAFRFQSPFAEAAYLLDHQAALLAADPAAAQPLPASWLGYHEAVTPLVRKPGDGERPVLAIVQPFKRDGRAYYLVAEMNPQHSTLNQFLRDLKPSASMHVVVIDENGIVLASPDPAHLLKPLPGADAFAERIRGHRPLVIEDQPAPLVPGPRGEAALTVMAPLQFAAWGVVIEQSNEFAFAGLDATGRAWLLTGAGLALMGVLLARTLSRSVVRPIRQLSQQATAMRGGDLATPITVTGDYEIEALAGTLDEARARLRATLEQLQAFNVRLEEQVLARTKVIVQQDEQRKVLVRRMLGATEDERRRLARELHDEIAQLLTVIQLSLHRINLDTPEMRTASDLLVRTQKEIHRIIYDLRPSLLDDLGLPTAMRSYARDHLATQGLRVNLEIEDGLPPRPEIETVVFRIYQELVTNILRHAGAEQVSIELYERDARLVLSVEDDGRGFDPDAKSEGAGLTGMRERAALVNGTIRFDSGPDVGTLVVLEIPLP
jgi:signal transduction histidine kinase